MTERIEDKDDVGGEMGELVTVMGEMTGMKTDLQHKYV